MSAGPSLYRRHRPRTFAEVVGQTHVVRTLRNAVERDKVHHAYLFVGSRGTGKTSMAKILAACLNCERGPTTEPCGSCDSCISIAAATSLDVIEMDAASNNSVDDIRELRDKVAYAPVSGRNKIYILDEAHMLSSAAWNAFLKTLEEPPPHTIFVLATTEANRVLPTVVDRCHRFDFTRPNVEEIGGVLRRVADQESIAIPDQALALVARHATGSFRDALGTLEQLVTYGGADGQITVAEVLAVLGVADAEALFGTVDAVAAHDARAALHAVARLVDAGRDAGALVRELEAHARELLAVQVLGEVPAELRLTPERDERLAGQAAALGRHDVVRLLDLLSEALEALANGASARIQLELAMVKAAAPEVDPSARALLARIDRLEQQLAERPAAAAPAPPAPAAAVAAPAPEAPTPAEPSAPAAAVPSQPIAPTPAPTPPTPAAAVDPVAPPAAARPSELRTAEQPRAAAPRPAEPSAAGEPSAADWAALAEPVAAAAPAPRPSEPPAPDLPRPATAAAAAATAPAPATPPTPAPTAPTAPTAPAPTTPAAAAPTATATAPPPPAPAPAPAATAVAAAPAGELDVAGLRELWPAVVEAVRAENAMLASVLRDARPLGVGEGEALLAFPTSAAFFKRKAESDECRRLVASALGALAGVALKPRYELRDATPADEAAEASTTPGAPALSPEELVARFVTEFDAEELIDDDEEGGA